MAYNAGLHEILATRLWDIHPMAYRGYRQRMEANLVGHIPFVMEREVDEGPYMLSSREAFQEKVYVGDADYVSWRNELDEEDRIINVVSVSGPITRGGGACSYGSKELRDMLMDLSGNTQVMGHIFSIDSPGGSASSKYDFEQAIAAVREAGQKTIAHIDGNACSAAYALASLCDEIYYTHPSNEVGCIGTMAAFGMNRHGDENAITKEKYVELYAEGSPYKNREFRAAADEEDYSLIQADLDRSAEDFKNMVRAMRPNVTDEQLLGDTYPAGEVEGTLVDGQKTMSQCVDRMLELCGYARSADTQSLEDPEAEDEGSVEGPEQDIKEDDIAVAPVEETNYTETNDNLNPTEMNKQYINIQNALGQAELGSDAKNALYLNEAQCDALEAHLVTCGQRSDALDAKMNEIEALNARIAEMEKAHAEALEALKVENQKALENFTAEKNAEMEALKGEHQQALEAKDAEMAEKQASFDATVAEMQGKIDEANSALEAKEAEIKEMENAGTQQPQAEAPADNSLEAETKTDSRVCKPGMTAKERREALQKQYGKPRC